MTQEEVTAAVREAVSEQGGEMLYQDFQDGLPPAAQLALPRHMERMFWAGDVVLAVRYNGETKLTNLYISVPSEGGE